MIVGILIGFLLAYAIAVTCYTIIFTAVANRALESIRKHKIIISDEE